MQTATVPMQDTNLESNPRHQEHEIAPLEYSVNLNIGVLEDQRRIEEVKRLLYEGFLANQEFLSNFERIPERESLKQEVNELLESAGSENWDGEGALAITPGLVRIAHEVIEKLPIYAAKPDVEATPHGEIDFDWVVDQNTMLTVSVAPPNVVAFAGTFPEARLAGKEEWAGELPHFVECCLKRIKQIGKL